MHLLQNFNRLRLRVEFNLLGLRTLLLLFSGPFAALVGSIDALDELVEIDLLIAIPVNLVHDLLQFFFQLWVHFPPEDNLNFFLADFPVVVPIEHIEGLPERGFLLLFFLFQSEGDKLAELQSATVVDVQFVKSLLCDLFAHLFAVDGRIPLDQFTD